MTPTINTFSHVIYTHMLCMTPKCICLCLILLTSVGGDGIAFKIKTKMNELINSKCMHFCCVYIIM